MFCVTCQLDLAECLCDDAAERIKRILDNDLVVFGEEYRKRLVDHAARRIREEAKKPITRTE